MKNKDEFKKEILITELDYREIYGAIYWFLIILVYFSLMSTIDPKDEVGDLYRIPLLLLWTLRYIPVLVDISFRFANLLMIRIKRLK